MSETLGATLERPLRLFADREAVVDGDERWTYRELGRRVAAFDAGLTELGLAAGDVVGVLGLNSAAHLVAWLAIPRSGRVLNDLNVRLAPAELQFILDDCSARVLLVDDAFLEVGRELEEGCETVEHLIYIGAGATPKSLPLIRRDDGRRGRSGCPGRPRSRRRDLLHRRHHRLAQGRDAHPPKPDRQREALSDGAALLRSGHLPACRADVPPRRWFIYPCVDLGRRSPRDDPGV